MKQRIVLALISSMAFNAFATSGAKVTLVKGEVTALKPGAQSASGVKMGETYPEDTSILTGEKSVVRLKFADNSTINLGPNSKVVVSQMPQNKPNMINLLTGAIKAEVNKKSDKDTDNKMIVKTRSAVMGVRGTKFQAGFNPTNGNTSLVTVEGNVAMVKKPVELASTRTADNVVQAAVSPEKELEKLDEVLKTSKEAVEVPAGRFSGVSEAVESAPTAPTKIAPVQYEALAKSMGSEKKAADVFTNKELEEAAKASADVAGAAPKAGGFVDFESGLYVPPPKDAKIDKATGVYIAENVGKVDESTGEYIPPKGVILDPKKGFVVDQEEVAKLTSAEDKAALQKTLASIKSVNEEVKKQVVVTQTETTSQGSSKKGWGPDKHILSVAIRPYSEKLTVENKISSTEADFFTKQANMTEIFWAQKWNEKFSTRLGIGFLTYKLDDSKVDINQNKQDESDDTMTLGASYRLNDRTTLKFDFVGQAYYYVTPEGGQGSDQVRISSNTTDYMRFGAEYFFMDWKKMQINLAGSYMHFTGGEVYLPSDGPGNNTQSIKGSGFRGDVLANYQWSNSLSLQFNAYLERTSQSVDNFTWTRNILGSGVNLLWQL
jgi:hypothetical protein